MVGGLSRTVFFLSENSRPVDVTTHHVYICYSIEIKAVDVTGVQFYDPLEYIYFSNPIL